MGKTLIKSPSLTERRKNLKKLKTAVSVGAMMCGILAALIFSIWIAVYGDSKYTFYKKEYQKYEVTKDLDMTIDQVMYVTDHMMSYLIGKEDKLSVITQIDGTDKDFFNERDRLHMADVRNLFLGGIKVGVVCIIAAVVIRGIMKRKEEDWKRLFLKSYTMAIAAWIFVCVLLGIAFYVDFTTCFTIFHKIFFTNIFWMFDPATDYMIRMLPEGFFSDMVIRVAEVFGIVLIDVWVIFFLIKNMAVKHRLDHKCVLDSE